MARAKEKYYVYVIELDKKFKSFRKIRQANPQRLSNKPCVNNGQNYYPLENRFEQHKEGYRSNKYAKEYGNALKPDLYDKYNPIPTRKDAVEIEAWLAKELIKKGTQFGMDNATLSGISSVMGRGNT